MRNVILKIIEIKYFQADLCITAASKTIPAEIPEFAVFIIFSSQYAFPVR